MSVAKLRAVAIVAGAAAVAAYLAVTRVDIRKTLSLLSAADLKLLPLIVLCELAFFTLNTLAFYSLLPRGSVSLKEAAGANAVAWLVDTLIPLAYVEGDVTRALALSRKLGGGRSSALAASFRFASASAFLTFVAVGAVVALWGGLVAGSYAGYVLVVIALSLALWVFLAILIVRWTAFEPLLAKLLGKVAGKLNISPSTVHGALREFGPSLKEVGAGKLLSAYAILLAQWVIALASPLLALRSVGAAVSPWALSAGYAILAAVSTASVGLPYTAGAMDAALAALFTTLGVSPEAAVAATAITRGISVSTSTVVMISLSAHYARTELGIEGLSSLVRWAKEAVSRRNAG